MRRSRWSAGVSDVAAVLTPGPVRLTPLDPMPPTSPAPAVPNDDLVGRVAERRLLDSALAVVADDGVGAVRVLTGPAGVGKSRLLADAAAKAERAGFRVLRGGADDLDRGIAYAALREALAPAIGAEDELSELAASVAAALRLDPDPLGEGATSTVVDRHAAVEQLLRGWARREPVLLAIDDLHVADEDTVALLALLSRTLQDSPVLVLVAMRPTPPDATVELTAMVDRLARRPHVSVIEVGPLPDGDVVTLIATRLAATPDPQLVSRCRDMSRGNPFYLEEMLRGYADAGALEVVGGVARLDPDAPLPRLSASSALLHRVFSLGKNVRAVARVLTAFQRFRLERIDLLAELAGLDLAQVDEAFDTMVRAGLVARVDRGYAFAHPIVRETLAQDVGPAQRRRLHGRIAEHLRRERADGAPVDILELAAHVAASASPGDGEAAAVLTEAGDLTASGAPRAAAVWYGDALDLLPPGAAETADLRARLARSLYLAQRLEAAAEQARLALDAAGGSHARAAVIRAVALSALGRTEEALAVTDVHERLEGEARARVLSERASLLVVLDRFEEAADCAVAATAAAGGTATGDAHALARAAAARVAFAQGFVEEALSVLRETLADAGDRNSASLLAVRLLHASFLAYGGFCDEALVALTDVEERIGRFGGETHRPAVSTLVVWARTWGGQWDGALERARTAAAEFERSGERFQRAQMHAAAALVHLHRGDLNQGRALLEADRGTVGSQSPTSLVTAMLHDALGETAQARDIIVAALDRESRTGRRQLTAQLLALLVAIEQAGDNPEAAAAALAQLESHVTEARLTPSLRVSLASARAVATRDPAHAREAVALAGSVGLGFDLAVNRLLEGELADDERALADAYTRLRAMGAQGLSRRAAGALRDRGFSVPGRPARRGQDGLTETERGLARHVAQGMTNRQIGRAMHLSPKTVEAYLSRLYAKVGCASRIDLAVAVEAGRIDVTPQSESETDQ